MKLETPLPPHELLGCLQQIEGELGRRRAERWGPRPIDLDLLLYDELILTTPELVLPHPRMAWRRFVLEPAAEVAGSMIHPTIGWTVARLLAHLNESMPYVAITGPIAAGKTRLAERLAGADRRAVDPGAARLVAARRLLRRPGWSGLGDGVRIPRRAHSVAGGEKGVRTNLCEAPAGPFRQIGPDPFFSPWAVSDFWFDQSAAFARAWLPAERLEAFLQRYERLRETVVRPRLIVLLDAPADELVGRIHGRGRQCERRLTAAQLERIRQAVIDASRSTRLGPGVACRRRRPGCRLRRGAGGGARNGVERFEGLHEN